MEYKNQDGCLGTKKPSGNFRLRIVRWRCGQQSDYSNKKELFEGYTNVDGVLAINHNYGCGVAIDAPGAAVPIRTLKNLAIQSELRRDNSRFLGIQKASAWNDFLRLVWEKPSCSAGGMRYWTDDGQDS